MNNDLLTSIYYSPTTYVKFLPFFILAFLFKHIIFSFVLAFGIFASVGLYIENSLSPYLSEVEKKHLNLKSDVYTDGIVFYPRKEENLHTICFDKKADQQVSRKEDEELIIYSCNGLKLKKCLEKTLDM